MSFWSTITGTTPQEEQQAQLDAAKLKYDAALQRRIDEGSISDEQVIAARQYENGLVLNDTDAAAAQGFVEGAAEGWNGVIKFPGQVVGEVGSNAGQLLGGVLKNIPWWVYLG